MINANDKKEMEELLEVAKKELTAELGDGEWNEWGIEHPDFLEWCDEQEMKYIPKKVPDPFSNAAPEIWVAHLECQGMWIGPCETEADAKAVCDFLNNRYLGGMVIEDAVPSPEMTVHLSNGEATKVSLNAVISIGPWSDKSLQVHTPSEILDATSVTFEEEE